MNKNKQQHQARQEAKIMAQPTVYTFNFKDVPADKYAETLSVLFANPDYAEAVEKRNRLVQTSARMRPNSNEMMNLIRTIQQHDRKLADLMYSSIVQTNLRSTETRDFLSFATLLKYYVDYRRDGIRERVDKLARRLDSITFLSDMLESLMVDIKADMKDVFNGEVEFLQFDAVQHVLTQLRGFFNTSRSKDGTTPEAQLYFDYSDSINDYLSKRLKTYTEKYRKLHPAPSIYNEDDMVEAINQFFNSGKHFGHNFIKRTATGGCYIDAVGLCFNLSPSQTAKLDKAVGATIAGQDADASLKYCFAVTDAIMATYQPSF